MLANRVMLSAQTGGVAVLPLRSAILPPIRHPFPPTSAGREPGAPAAAIDALLASGADARAVSPKDSPTLALPNPNPKRKRVVVRSPLVGTLIGSKWEAGCILLPQPALTCSPKHARTPLHRAASYEQRLLTSGSCEQDGRTPLHLAARRGNLKAAARLMESGASLTAEDGEGKTPQHVAAEAGHSALASKLAPPPPSPPPRHSLLPSSPPPTPPLPPPRSSMAAAAWRCWPKLPPLEAGTRTLVPQPGLERTRTPL